MILIACLFFLFSVFLISLWYIYKNIPLRTAIYRLFFKQVTYITSEDDIIYSFGYFGVRKQILKSDGSLRLIMKNESFCHNCFVGHLIARSGVIHGEYIYVAARSYLGGRWKSNSKGYMKGMLIIMRKLDLKILTQIEVDYSMIEAKIYNNVLAVSGLQGFNIYDISEAELPRLVYTFRTEEAWEFQGCEFIKKEFELYVAFARWSEGVSIYDVTDLSSIHLVETFSIQNEDCPDLKLNQKCQSFGLTFKYPYLFSTIGPTPPTQNTISDKRGVIAFDVSNINQVKKTMILIPNEDWYISKKGDPQPTYIDYYDNRLYVNFAEKGIAVFNILNNEFTYQGLINIPQCRKVLPIHITKKGILLVGDYNSDRIISLNLKNKHASKK